MRLTNLAGYNSIDEFVASKLKRLNEMPKNFASLYEMMFSEKDNIIYEKSVGYRIEKTTYGECKDIIEYRSSSLKKLIDAPQNSVVGIYMDNSLEWIEMLWSVLKCGYRPMLLNLRLDTETLEKALMECEAVAVISDKKSFTVKTILEKDIEIADIKYSDDNEFGSEILVMSSGTTANVKVCGYGASEIKNQVHDSYDFIKKSKIVQRHYEGELKLLTFLPFYHIFGLVAVYIWFAFFSRTFVQLNDMSSQTVVNTIRRHKVTHIFAIPLFWEKVYESAIKEIKSRGEKTYAKLQKGLKIAEKIGDVPVLGNLFIKKAFKEVRDGMFGDSIQFLITGGSGIDEDVIKFFNYIGYHLSDGYGMTEIGITSVELSNNRKLLTSCSVGSPMSSIEYSINENGELLVKGITTAKYVIEGGKRTERSDEWFNTHDLAEYRDGAYFILGRKDDLVISSSGENLNPNIIEPKFDISGIDRCCLIYDNIQKQSVLVVSVKKYLDSDKYKEILTNINNRINEINLSGQIGKIVLVSDLLIGNDEFKVNRTKIRKKYLDGKLNIIDPNVQKKEEIDDELMAKIKLIFATALGKDISEIYSDTEFFTDGGGSSLDYFGMVSQLQDEFDIGLPIEDGSTISKVSDIYEYIKKAM